MHSWFIFITRDSHSTLGELKCYVMVQTRGRRLPREGVKIKKYTQLGHKATLLYNFGTCWHILAHFDTFWHFATFCAYFITIWHILKYFDIFWHILAYFEKIQETDIWTDGQTYHVLRPPPPGYILTHFYVHILTDGQIARQTDICTTYWGYSLQGTFWHILTDILTDIVTFWHILTHFGTFFNVCCSFQAIQNYLHSINGGSN